jgi:hypothetical protein
VEFKESVRLRRGGAPCFYVIKPARWSTVLLGRRLRREAPCFYVIKPAPLETQINICSEDCTAFSGLNENE